MKFFKITVAFFVFLSLLNCSKSDSQIAAQQKSSAKEIITFEIPNIVTVINNQEKKITINVSAAVSNMNLRTKITLSDKATLANYALESNINYAYPVTIDVVAEDFSRVNYTVEVIRIPVVGLTKFQVQITNPGLGTFDGVINEVDKTILVLLNKDNFISFPLALKKVVVEATAGYTTNLVTGNNIDINSTTSLILTSPNGTTVTYQVFVISTAQKLESIIIPSTYQLQDILLFGVNAPSSTSFPSAGTGLQSGDIIVRTLLTEDVSNMVPAQLATSRFATISPSATTPQNFNTDVSYTVTSESGTSATYKVRLVKEKIIVQTDYSGQINNNQTSASGYFRYVAVSKVASIKFQNIQNNQLVDGNIVQNHKQGTTDEYYLSYTVPTGTVGTFKLIVTLLDGSIITTYYKSMYTL